MNETLSQNQILQAIDRIDCQLSPENLYCDGEITHAQGQAKARRLMTERNRLEKLLGKSVEYKG